MTAAISPPVRIVAVLGLLAAVGAAVFFFVLARPGAEPATQPQAVARPTTTPAPTTKPVARRATAPAVSKTGLPLALERALRTRRVAVVTVYVPGAALDASVRREARAAALGTRAAFLAVPTTNTAFLDPLVAKVGVFPAPAVLVVKRPGKVVTTFGVTDRELVAQAVRQAKR